MAVPCLAIVLLIALGGQTPSREALLAERDALVQKAGDAREQGQPAAAIGFAERALALERQLFGNVHPNVAGSLEFLTAVHEEALQLDAALRRAREAFDVVSTGLPPGDWRVTDARLRIRHLERRLSLSDQDNRLLQAAEAQHRSAFELTAEGRYREALAIAEQVLQLRRRLLGIGDNATIAILNNTAYMLSRLGDFARARRLYEEALAARIGDLGIEHPSAVRSRNNLAELLSQMGDYQEAETHYLEALAASRIVNGDEAPSTLAILSNLGVVYQRMGNVARAEELFRVTLDVRRRTLGSRHLSTAANLTNLATLYAEMGDDARAQTLYEEALEIHRAANGPDHPETAHVMTSLAAIYDHLDDNERAIAMFERALQIQRRTLGEDHPTIAITVNNLALLYVEENEIERATPLFEQATRIRRAVYGPSAFLAQSLSNEAWQHARRKDYTRAERVFREAIEMQRTFLPPRHPDFEATLDGLGTMLLDLGDRAKAAPLIREALEISLWNLDLASAAQSERQLLLMTSRSRAHLETYLLLSDVTGHPPADAWALTTGWKGRAMVRQRAGRAAAGNPQTRAIVERLQQVAAELSQLALTPSAPEAAADISRRVNELTSRKEDLERQLGASGAKAGVAPPSAAAIRAAIPAGAALVDCFDVHGVYAAFIVRRDGAIVYVRLGASDDVHASLERWHALTKSNTDATGPARQLKALVFAPLEPHLRPGETLLISPEGALGSLAFAALPGRESGRFLLQDHPIAMIPAPALLPELVSREPVRDAAGGLLAIGDVDYEAAAVPPAPAPGVVLRRAPNDAGAAFEPLPGTASEIKVVARHYRSMPSASNVVSLTGSDATEHAVRDQAPRNAHIHLATHGFFASARFRSALLRTSDTASSDVMHYAQSVAGYNPGLLSGLVFAGANKPDAASDGILTASEVETLDLSGVRLAVLSACETGLGLAAGGEGLLGLQRAFQTAGAQTVIASMWNVDDEATRTLMERFYGNLWTKRMGRLDALREAQLSMLGDGRPPFFWGAFVLSGDWR